MNSASSISQVLCGELADGQRTLMAIATAGAESKEVNTSVTQLSSGPLAGLHEFVCLFSWTLFLRAFWEVAFYFHSNTQFDITKWQVEAPIDPTKELSRLLAENKCEEAFIVALHKSDVSIVSWLCSQVHHFPLLVPQPYPPIFFTPSRRDTGKLYSFA